MNSEGWTPITDEKAVVEERLGWIKYFAQHPTAGSSKDEISLIPRVLIFVLQCAEHRYSLKFFFLRKKTPQQSTLSRSVWLFYEAL